MHLTEERKTWLVGYCRQVLTASIETERLFLRPFVPEDLNDFFALASDADMCRLSGESPLHSMEEAKTALDELMGLYRHICRTFAIVRKADGRVIGHFDLGFYPFLEKDEALCTQRGVSLSFALVSDCQQQGYMTELMQRMLLFFFEETNLDFVNCGHFDFNVGSMRLQKRLGFGDYMTHVVQREGQDLTVIEHLLTKAQYQAQNQ